MSLTDIVKTLGYDPEQTGQLLNIVRQNILQLKSFEQLPDDRLEKMGLPIAVIYAVRNKLSSGTESPAAPLQTPRKQKPAVNSAGSTPVQIRTPVITPESINGREPASLEDLRALTRGIKPEIEGHKMKLASTVCKKMVEVFFFLS